MLGEHGQLCVGSPVLRQVCKAILFRSKWSRCILNLSQQMYSGIHRVKDGVKDGVRKHEHAVCVLYFC